MTATVENLKALGYKLVPGGSKVWYLYRPTLTGTSLIGVITGEMLVEDAWEIALSVATDATWCIPEIMQENECASDCECHRQDFP